MSTLTRDAMRVRVRRMFLEELGSGQATDFVDETQVPDEIDEAWDEACAEHHGIVLGNAEAAGRLEDHDNAYLQRYLQRWVFTISRGVVEYGPVPARIARTVKLEVDGIRGIRKSPQEDRLIRTWPSQYGPGRGEVFWTVLSQGLQSPPDPADSTRRLRVYVYGDTLQDLTVAAPLVGMTGELTFYRLIDPISYYVASQTDIEDPWADGPIHGTVARLQEKAQQSEIADRHYARAKEIANAVIPLPPQQAAQ